MGGDGGRKLEEWEEEHARGKNGRRHGRGDGRPLGEVNISSDPC